MRGGPFSDFQHQHQRKGFSRQSKPLIQRPYTGLEEKNEKEEINLEKQTKMGQIR